MPPNNCINCHWEGRWIDGLGFPGTLPSLNPRPTGHSIKSRAISTIRLMGIDADGAPLTGVRVNLQSNYGVEVLEGLSGSDGTPDLSAFKEGAYVTNPTKPGYVAMSPSIRVEACTPVDNLFTMVVTVASDTEFEDPNPKAESRGIPNYAIVIIVFLTIGAVAFYLYNRRCPCSRSHQ